MNKDKINLIERLYNEGKITFEEAMQLMPNTIEVKVEQKQPENIDKVPYYPTPYWYVIPERIDYIDPFKVYC